MNTATLITGEQVSSASEAWRHECEARHVAGMPTREARRDYLDRVAAKRGIAARDALARLAQQIYTAQRQGAHA